MYNVKRMSREKRDRNRKKEIEGHRERGWLEI